jgi:hypothetical protein
MTPELASFLEHTRVREIGTLFLGRGRRIGVKPYEGLFVCPNWPQIQTVSKDCSHVYSFMVDDSSRENCQCLGYSGYDKWYCQLSVKTINYDLSLTQAIVTILHIKQF